MAEVNRACKSAPQTPCARSVPLAFTRSALAVDLLIKAVAEPEGHHVLEQIFAPCMLHIKQPLVIQIEFVRESSRHEQGEQSVHDVRKEGKHNSGVPGTPYRVLQHHNTPKVI